MRSACGAVVQCALRWHNVISEDVRTVCDMVWKCNVVAPVSGFAVARFSGMVVYSNCTTLILSMEITVYFTINVVTYTVNVSACYCKRSLFC